MRNEDTLAKIGKILDREYGRDAVHIAVAPVRAGADLFPGERIGLMTAGNKELAGRCPNPIGIVDPFLENGPKAGELFYIWLFPNTITTLTHLWTHPAFEPAAGADEHETWLRTFADNSKLSYQELLAAAGAFLSRGAYVSSGGLYEGWDVPDEFWNHYEKVTGRLVGDGERGSFFSCAC